MPGAQPLYAGYIALARHHRRSVAARRSLHGEIFAHNVVCYPDGDAMTMYAVPGPNNDVRPGHRDYNWVWYHPLNARRAGAPFHRRQWFLPWQFYWAGVDPPAVDRRRCAPRRVKALAPQCVRGDRAHRAALLSSHLRSRAPRAWRIRRTAILGDAAFVARPHVGMGVTKAALDARVPGRCAPRRRADLDVALARYNQRQHLFGTRVIARARLHRRASGRAGHQAAATHGPNRSAIRTRCS